MLQALFRSSKSSAHPVDLRGRFSGDSLVYVIAPDAGLEFERRPGEDGDSFERRVIVELCRYRGMTPPPLYAEEPGGDDSDEAGSRSAARRPGPRPPSHPGSRGVSRLPGSGAGTGGHARSAKRAVDA